MSEVIVVTSGKGGVGKTTTSANVGTGLAEMGKKVVLIDADIGLRNLDVVMGLENRIVYNLVDVIEGTCRLKQALIKDKRHAGLYLMPAAQTRDKTGISECNCRGRSCNCCNNAGSISNQRCRQNHRIAGGK